MSNYKPVPEGKDPILWEIAQKRASFKNHAIVYVIVNAFLWAVWYITAGQTNQGEGGSYPWPIWTTLGWGIGIAFHYAAAYVSPKVNATEREYDKLKNKQ
ncbi:MAG: 2TM domain-containing protein [Ferruginibacter sp.]|nr:2TM domain-containing protein [Ferruginibacter sp.]